MLVEDYYIGGYNVPAETKLRATVNLGIGKAVLVIKTKDLVVETAVTLKVEGYGDQADVITMPVQK